MASGSNLFATWLPAHPNPSSIAELPARSRRDPSAFPSAPISASIPAPCQLTERRSWAWAMGGSVEAKPKKMRELVNLQCIRRDFSCNAELAENGGEVVEEEVPDFEISRLEAYTDKFRREVLCVNALLEDEEEDQVIVFKGFSSSLIRPTPDDPSDTTLPPTAVVQSIDRMRAPYNPAGPQYIQQGLSWREFHCLLEEKGL